MNFYSKSLVSFVVLFAAYSACFGQEITETSDIDFISIYNETKEKYVVDPLIQNGVYYENPYFNAQGHQFFRDGKFHEGSIVFREKQFEGVRLKYDIFNQQLIINQDPDMHMQVNLLPGNLVSEFHTNGSYFKSIALEDDALRYYQVMYESAEISCYYYWHKNRSESHEAGEYLIYVFSEPKQKSYIKIEDLTSRYRNNRSFVKCLPEGVKSQVKTYMKTNKIDINEADKYALEELFSFCQLTISQAKK